MYPRAAARGYTADRHSLACSPLHAAQFFCTQGHAPRPAKRQGLAVRITQRPTGSVFFKKQKSHSLELNPKSWTPTFGVFSCRWTASIFWTGSVLVLGRFSHRYLPNFARLMGTFGRSHVLQRCVRTALIVVRPPRFDYRLRFRPSALRMLAKQSTGLVLDDHPVDAVGVRCDMWTRPQQ